MRASLRNVGVTRLERVSAQQVLAASVVLTDDARRTQLSAQQLKARQASVHEPGRRPGSRLDLGDRRASPAGSHRKGTDATNDAVSPGWGVEATGRVSPSPSQWQEVDPTAALLQDGAVMGDGFVDGRQQGSRQLVHLDLRENRLVSIASIGR